MAYTKSGATLSSRRFPSSVESSHSQARCDAKKCAMMTTKTTPCETQPVRCAVQRTTRNDAATAAVSDRIARRGSSRASVECVSFVSLSSSRSRSSRDDLSARAPAATTRSSAARTRSPTRPSIIVVHVSAASAKSIHASIRPTCRAMATTITAALNEYSMNRSQDAIAARCVVVT